MKNEHYRCLISGASDLVPLKGYEDHYLVKSKSSGFVFSSRIPTEEELIKHYDGYPRHDSVSTLTQLRYNELLDKMESYRNYNRLLDVGCGNGHFLKVARERGWQVYGTEFTDEAVDICTKKGIIMNQGKLDSNNYEANFFDVITSFEVLEHINNPIEEVSNLHKILKKGGLFYFTTPNFNALERYILKDKYNVIEYPEHLSYYTPSTINYLFTNHGFKKNKIETTGVSISRLKKSLTTTTTTTTTTTNNNNNKEQAKREESADELIRVKIESNQLLTLVKKSMNKILTILGIGNSLKGWYIKV